MLGTYLQDAMEPVHNHRGAGPGADDPRGLTRDGAQPSGGRQVCMCGQALLSRAAAVAVVSSSICAGSRGKPAGQFASQPVGEEVIEGPVSSGWLHGGRGVGDRAASRPFSAALRMSSMLLWLWLAVAAAVQACGQDARQVPGTQHPAAPADAG